MVDLDGAKSKCPPNQHSQEYRPANSTLQKKKFAIGQRTFLIETPEGNVLWDLITYLDGKTIEFVSILSFS